MNYISLMILAFAVGLSGALIPGPLLVFTISQVMKKNAWEGIKAILGHIIVEAVTIALLLIGLSYFVKSALFQIVISFVGGVTLIFISAFTIIKSRNAEFDITQNATRKYAYGAVVGGMVFSVFNPSFPLWWATIGLTLLTKALLLGILGMVFFLIGHWASDVAWYAFVSYAVHKGKKAIKTKAYRVIMITLSLILAGFGVYFLVNGFISIWTG